MRNLVIGYQLRVLVVAVCALAASANACHAWPLQAAEPESQSEGSPAPDAQKQPEKKSAKKFSEVIIPGPTDEDVIEQREIAPKFEALTDRAQIVETEMPAYWHLMRWARAQTFAEMEKRALKDSAMTNLWEQPDKYRGKLLKLRLHIVRVIEQDDVKENSAGVKKLYEIWGPTDQSASYPYVVLVPELPPGIKLGQQVNEEGTFVGYFYKNMLYEAFDKPRYAPVLIGRLKGIASRAGDGGRVKGLPTWMWFVGAGMGVVVIACIWLWFDSLRARKRKSASNFAEVAAEDFFGNPSGGTEPVMSSAHRDSAQELASVAEQSSAAPAAVATESETRATETSLPSDSP